MNQALLFVCLIVGAERTVADWPQFRGPDSAAAAPAGNLPLTWETEEGGANVAWRSDLPGRGPSSPIVVDGRVVVTCSSGVNQDRLHVLCFDSAAGNLRWERQFWATGRTLTNPTSANAAPTPASDGEAIYAFFSSCDLICLDLEGNLRWYRGLGMDYPKTGNDAGMGSSPVVIGGVVIVQAEAQGDSYALGIDAQTGETRWRLDRRREASWSSPVALLKEDVGRAVALLQSPRGITAVDPYRGEVLWEHAAACDAISSPVALGKRIYIPANGLAALNVADGAAAVEVAWESPRLRPGAGSAAVSGDRVYLVNNSGVLVCGDAAAGEVLWQLRLEGRCWATPVVTGDRLYAVNSDGKAFAVQLGDKGKVLGESDFGQVIQGTPAVSGDAIYIRSDRHLWKFALPRERP